MSKNSQTCACAG